MTLFEKIKKDFTIEDLAIFLSDRFVNGALMDAFDENSTDEEIGEVIETYLNSDEGQTVINFHINMLNEEIKDEEL